MSDTTTLRRALRRMAAVLALTIAFGILIAAAVANAEESPPPDEDPPVLISEDLGPATVPIEDAESVTDTIRAALDDHARREQAGVGIAAVTAGLEPFEIPLRLTGSGRTIFVPLVRGPGETAPVVEPPPPPPPPPPARPAELTVMLWPEPSIRVARDGTLTYELRLYNDGTGDARSTRVTLPFDPQQLTLIGTRLDRSSGDWVSEVRGDRVTITFGELDSRERRSGFVTFRVARWLADNTVLSMRPTYSVTDGRGVREGSGNWAPVLVGGGNDTGLYVWMIGQPLDGRASELRTFFSNRFAPGEPVTAWLNTPQGVRQLDVRELANSEGHVWIDYRPSALAPGSYQLVAYGNRSRLTGVTTFTVR